MESVVSILQRERASAQSRLDELSTEARDLRQRIREIEDAISVLSGHVSAPRPLKSFGGNLQSLIMSHLASAGTAGSTARDIAAAIRADGRETSEPSVSSTLSRMKGDGEVENRQGRWFAKIEIQGGVVSEPDKVEAPVNTRASNGRVAELEAPARSEQHPFRKGENVGSSPTPPSQIVEEAPPSRWDDPDDEIPF